MIEIKSSPKCDSDIKMVMNKEKRGGVRLVTCADAIREVMTDPNKVYSTREVINLIYQKHPNRPWKESTIRCYLIGLSVNHPSSIYYPSLHKRAFLFSLGRGRWKLYDPKKYDERTWGESRSDFSEKIKLLEKLEDKAIFCTLAMMAYNPSIGRVFRSGGVDEFVHVSCKYFHNIYSIQSREEFDKWHDEFVNEIINTIRTTSRERIISYGQAQKPVNVFLKVYVDWAELPKPEIAKKIRPYLHVPLDSVVMRYVRRHFHQYYKKFKLRILPLSKINKEQYYSWQRCFREIHPQKPLIIDVFWAIKRFGYDVLKNNSH